MFTEKDLKRYISYILFGFGECANIVGLANSVIHHYGLLSKCFTGACLASMTLLFIITRRRKKPEIFIQLITTMVGILYFPLIFSRTLSPSTFVLNTFLIPVSYSITVKDWKSFIIPIINLIIFDIFVFTKLSMSHFITYTVIYLYVLIVPSLFSMVLSRYGRQLAKENERVNELANRDALTGLYNRTYLSQFYGKWICIAIMTDIDFFKKINDKYGHDEGDRILKELAKIFLKYKEEKFKIFRYGGEEFIILSALSEQETDEKIVSIVSNVRKSLRTIDNQKVTISVGVGYLETFSEGAIKVADTNLYLSKHNGRNCISKNGETFFKET